MAAVLEGKGRRVRLRDDHSLPCAVDIGGRVIRFTLPPNQWVTPPEPIYQMLKQKFTVRTERAVPDFDLNDQHPHKAGHPAMTRTETNTGYIIEGLDD